MLNHRRFALALLFLVILSSLGHAAAQDSPTLDTVPPYSVRGAYGVGTHRIVLDPGTDHALVIDTWYPAQKSEKKPDKAVEDAALDLSNAPYPLVIYSHGFYDYPTNHPFIQEHLASWGFVVLAPNHLGDNPNSVYPGFPRRLLEVKQAIENADAQTVPGGYFEGMIDTENVAVIGFSSGGTTAYGAAGAPLNWPTVERYCAETEDEFSCPNLSVQKEAMQTLIGTNISADGTWPAIWDPRVKAIVPMAGTVELYSREGLSEITIPMMVLMGSGDQYAFPEWVEPAYEVVSSSDKALVVFEGANHMIFTDYTDTLWHQNVSHPLIDHFMTAFLLDALKGDADAHAALLPAAVQFDGIQYETTLK